MSESVEDFSGEADSAAAPAARQSNVIKVYDPNPERESIRGRIAMQLLWLMGAILLAMALMLVFRIVAGVDDLLKLTGALLTPVVGLFGAVIGFYFGEKSAAGSSIATSRAPAHASPPVPPPTPGE